MNVSRLKMMCRFWDVPGKLGSPRCDFGGITRPESWLQLDEPSVTCLEPQLGGHLVPQLEVLNARVFDVSCL